MQQDGYSYTKGNAIEKTNPNFTLASWNICTLSGGVCRPCGGMIEANKTLNGSKRIDRIIDQIKQADPDVLVLSEVWGKDVENELIKHLKDSYAHIYTDMGKHAFGVDSGLMVLSKYHVKDFSFTPFTEATGDAKWIKKGFASFTIQSNQKDLSHIVTSHLQHGSSNNQKVTDTRQSQMGQIVNHSKKQICPVFFAGDANIPRETKEYESSLISKYFTPTYDVKKGYTCTNFFERDLFKGNKEFSNPPSIVDHIARFSVDPDTDKPIDHKDLQVQTERWIAHDIERPEEARSDHHGLISRITTDPS